jgi:hypothetical protein
MNYKINSIGEDGTPNITYTTDGGNTNTENLTSATGLNLDDLSAFMLSYCQAYDAGITLNEVIIDPSITKVIGKTQTPSEEVVSA